jgi:selenocysteine lyase/cysteine desulfurase
MGLYALTKKIFTMNNRRKFIKQLGAIVPAVSALNISYANFNFIEEHHEKNQDRDPKEVARDEEYWRPIQQSFEPSPHFINLDHAFYCAAPTIVMDRLLENTRRINQLTALYMRRHDIEDRFEIRKKMADFAGVAVEELLITRSTTESLDAVIMGLEIGADEEVIIAETDYHNMVATWQMKEKRYGVKIKTIKVPITPKNPKEIIDLYAKAITPKTKYIHLTHLINYNGQILPVKEITEIAHRQGIEVICDSSQSFAHIDFKISDLNCDYWAASLHKWLAAPVGSGLLYIKKEKIKKVWPLFGDYRHPEDDIRKFERIGTYPSAIYLTIADSLRFHNSIGTKFQEERLRYLKDYWTSKVVQFPKIKFTGPLDEKQSCGIANFAVEGKTPFEVADYLYDKHKIFTVGYDRGGITGVRVTPHIYTTLKELDKLVKAVEMYCKA